MNNSEPFDEVKQVRVGPDTNEPELPQALISRFREKFRGEELERLGKQYRREMIALGDASSSVTETRLIRYAITKGLIAEKHTNAGSGKSNPNETLLEAEDRLRREINELEQKWGASKDANERARLDNAIQGISAGLETVQSEKGAQRRPERFENPQTGDSIQDTLSKWNFSSSCIDLLDDAVARRKYFQIQSPNRIIPLTPEIVMLMLLIRGCSHKRNPDYLAAVLATAFSLSEKTLEQILTEKFANSSNVAEFSSSIISPRLKEVFDFAENISRKVSAKGRISQRHLIAALLYGNNNSQISKSGLQLPPSIFRPTEFVWELEKYVKSSPTVRTKELAQEWEHVIAEIRHGFPLPEGAARLASEIRGLEEIGVDTTDHAERVQINAELNRKHAELDAVLAKRPNEANLRAWDAEFAALRKDAGFRWSTTLDRVLDLLWKEHSRAFNESLSDGGRFERLISPRALFLVALKHSTASDLLLTGREDKRGKTLDNISKACGLTADRIEQLLKAEFTRPSQQAHDGKNRAVVSEELYVAVVRADQIRKTFGNDPYIGTRHLFLAMLEAPPNGRTGDQVIRNDDEIDRAAIITGFRTSVMSNAWVERYEANADWPTQFRKLETELTSPQEAGDVSQVGNPPNPFLQIPTFGGRLI